MLGNASESAGVSSNTVFIVGPIVIHHPRWPKGRRGLDPLSCCAALACRLLLWHPCSYQQRLPPLHYDLLPVLPLQTASTPGLGRGEMKFEM